MKTKKTLVLFIILLFLAVFIMFFLYQVINSNKIGTRDLHEIEKEGILNIVTEYNSVDYYISGDTIAGLQYELSKYIGKRSGLAVHIYLENNLDASIKGLNKNKYDIIARSIPITNENRRFLAFTIPITQNKQVLIQRKSDEENTPLIRNQIDLANKTIYIPKNSPSILRIKNLAEEIAEPIYIEEVENYTQEQIIYMVAYKEIDYAVVDKEIALKNKQLFPEIDLETDISFTQLQAWAVRQESPILLDSLNIWIQDYLNN